MTDKTPARYVELRPDICDACDRIIDWREQLRQRSPGAYRMIYRPDRLQVSSTGQGQYHPAHVTPKRKRTAVALDGTWRVGSG